MTRDEELNLEYARRKIAEEHLKAQNDRYHPEFQANKPAMLAFAFKDNATYVRSKSFKNSKEFSAFVNFMRSSKANGYNDVRILYSYRAKDLISTYCVLPAGIGLHRLREDIDRDSICNLERKHFTDLDSGKWIGYSLTKALSGVFKQEYYSEMIEGFNSVLPYSKSYLPSWWNDGFRF